MNVGKKQMVELIQLLIDKPEVQALFSMDEFFFINDRAAANIDKAELKVQELRVVCARLDEIVDTSKTKTKTEAQRAGELVAQTRLVKAKQTLVKLQATQERPRKRQKTLVETEKWAVVPGDAWRKMIDHVSRTLFAVPSHLQQKWTGTVSTNGVVVHWHLKRKSNSHRRKMPKGLRRLSSLSRPHLRPCASFRTDTMACISKIRSSLYCGI
jgi:hypothetical protein